MKLLIWLTMGTVLLAFARPSEATPDFELTHSDGHVFRSADCRGRALVVAFLGTECPLARLYAMRLNELAARYAQQGVDFIAVDANEQDSMAEIVDFAKSVELRFPILRDAAGDVARLLDATRSPEVILLDAARDIVYRGRIDDQYEPGARRPQPSREDLREAIDDVLANRAVRTPRTAAVGCLLNLRAAKPLDTSTTFDDVRPILQKHCVECHRPGQVAPFSLRTFDEVQPWASTIREVIEQGRMPPWHANPKFGHFANERRLSDDERSALLKWIDGGAGQGSGIGSQVSGVGSQESVSEHASSLTPDSRSLTPPSFTPDLLIQLPQPITIPATGVMDYQYVMVDPHFTEDRWIQAAELRPGNRAVVHHATAYLSPPGTTDQIMESGALGSFCLVTYVPGQEAQAWPHGVAKRIPGGWRIAFVIHYVPNGTPQTDRTTLALKFVDAANVRKELATKVLIDPSLKIPPQTSDYRSEQSWQAPADMLLYAMFPHMHLRGKSFRYEVTYPGGEREILLDVPKYDFNWQHRYVLAEPKRLPAGSVLRCEAHYDNSAANPNNPDPNATVLTGEQSTDEMFNGYFDVALADQDMVAEARWQRIKNISYPAVAAILCGLLILSFRHRGGAGNVVGIVPMP